MGHRSLLFGISGLQCITPAFCRNPIVMNTFCPKSPFFLYTQLKSWKYFGHTDHSCVQHTWGNASDRLMKNTWMKAAWYFNSASCCLNNLNFGASTSAEIIYCFCRLDFKPLKSTLKKSLKKNFIQSCISLWYLHHVC